MNQIQNLPKMEYGIGWENGMFGKRKFKERNCLLFGHIFK